MRKGGRREERKGHLEAEPAGEEGGLEEQHHQVAHRLVVLVGVRALPQVLHWGEGVRESSFGFPNYLQKYLRSVCGWAVFRRFK